MAQHHHLTTTLAVTLPSEVYAKLEAFGRLHNISTGHAAALTIMAGQQLQSELNRAASQSGNDRESWQELNDAMKRAGIHPSQVPITLITSPERMNDAD